MRCCEVEAFWDDYREGIEERCGGVRTHLASCEACQELYRQFEGVAYSLSCLSAVEPPSGLVRRIAEHLKRLEPDGLARIASPIGELFVAFRPQAITSLGLDAEDDDETLRRRVELRLRRPVRYREAPIWVRDVVEAYFRTWRVDAARTDLSCLTPFERAALAKAAEIPPGEVRSYGWIAREIGRPSAARAVGRAMARNPIAFLFPCHRVVAAAGSLHNYGYGLELKERLLRMEGYRPPATATARVGIRTATLVKRAVRVAVQDLRL